MQRKIIHALFATVAAVATLDAHAQVDQFSLNYTKVEWDYRNDRTGGLPFALDIVHGETGTVSMRPIGTHNLTLKRGQFYPADPLPQAWLGYEMGRRGGARAGHLSLAIDQSGSSAGGGPVITVYSGDAGSVHASGAQFALGDGSVRFVRDSNSVQLRGEPAALFNLPGPGEALEARLPVPVPGQTIALMLTVMDDRGQRTTLPVRISNPR